MFCEDLLRRRFFKFSIFVDCWLFFMKSYFLNFDDFAGEKEKANWQWNQEIRFAEKKIGST